MSSPPLWDSQKVGNSEFGTLIRELVRICARLSEEHHRELAEVAHGKQLRDTAGETAYSGSTTSEALARKDVGGDMKRLITPGQVSLPSPKKLDRPRQLTLKGATNARKKVCSSPQEDQEEGQSPPADHCQLPPPWVPDSCQSVEGSGSGDDERESGGSPTHQIHEVGSELVGFPPDASPVKNSNELSGNLRVGTLESGEDSLVLQTHTDGGARTSEVIMEGESNIIILRPEWEVSDEALRQTRRQSTTIKHSVSPTTLLRQVTRKATARRSATMMLKSRSALSWAGNPMHPESLIRLTWEVSGLAFLSYDMIVLPLQLFDIPDAETMFSIMEWVTLIFWSLDMLFTSTSGTYINGELVADPRQVFRHYAKTWFVFDATIITNDWISIITDSTGLGSALRGIRVLRFVRLLRMAKMQRLFRGVQERINSLYFLLCFGILKHIAGLMLINHVVACLWYGAGTVSNRGWVYQFVDSQEEDDFAYAYLTSLHWASCQFQSGMDVQPQNAQERLVAVAVVFFALILFSWFLSSMTNAMMDLQSLRQQKVAQQRALLAFLQERRISHGLSLRVKKYLEKHAEERAKTESEVKLLELLPQYLLMDVHQEMHLPVLEHHGLFSNLNKDYPRTVRRFCHEGVAQMTVARHADVFAAGDICTRMFFVDTGKLRYVAANMLVGDTGNPSLVIGDVLMRGQWICEVALWSVWENVGTLMAQSTTDLLTVNAVEAMKCLRSHERVFMDVVLYAREFIDTANATGCTDRGIVVEVAGMNWHLSSIKRRSQEA